MLIGLRNVFKIQNLDQIDDLYMETGMYLSADVLEHFLYLCLGMYCIVLMQLIFTRSWDYLGRPL